MIRNYLLSLGLFESRRGRPLSHGGILKQMRAIVDAFAASDEKLHLLRAYTRLEEQLEFSRVGSKALVAEFVKHAAPYGERKGLSYADWRRLGVPTAVLGRAGVKR